MKNKTEKPFISVIVPVYNVEKYIASAISDILGQTFQDFELILVLDCPTDNSSAICHAFAAEDERIKIIQLEKNSGVSVARNMGIKVAHGKYVTFLDSDDSFYPYLLENYVTALEEMMPEADVVVCGLCEEHYNKKEKLVKKIPICPERKILKTAEDVRKNLRYLEETSLYGYPWNKMYNTNKLKDSGVCFPNMKFNEDIIFNIDFFNYVNTCVILDNMPYRYKKRVNSSTTSKYIPTYYEDIMVKIDELCRQFERFDLMTDENKVFIAQRYVRYVFSAIERNIDKRSKMKRKERKAFLENVIASERYKFLKDSMKDSGLSGIMTKNLKKGNVKCCLFIGRIIYLVKKLFPRLFGKIS